jgi:hypothetical protein
MQGFAHNKAPGFILASVIMDSLERATLLGNEFKLARMILLKDAVFISTGLQIMNT